MFCFPVITKVVAKSQAEHRGSRGRAMMAGISVAEHENEQELMEYNELIRAELCRTRSADKKSIWNRPTVSSA
jgi:hypothetical protein